MKCVIVHYSEIGTKGRNRRFFEKRLTENIRKITGKATLKNSRIISGTKNANKLALIPGISNYALAVEVPSKLPNIRKAVLAVAKKSKAKTFRITATRSNKNFSLNSLELQHNLGRSVRKKCELKNPELEIFVEVADKTYVYGEKLRGPGGMPVGSAGRVVCLLSGGIDSPVAAYKMMTRGCKVIFVHFHNFDPFMTKIKKLTEILAKFQGKSTLYLVPFKEVQAEIIKKTDPKYRMLLYRRLMMKISQEILTKEGALGLVTGDSVSQVASQTLENLNVIHDAATSPIFSPLIGTNKQDIVNEAQKIGTYDTSIRPYDDCCSVLIGKHPATRAEIKPVKALEKKLKIETLIKKALKKKEMVVI